MSRVVRRSSFIPVFSATAIQISGVSTPSMSKVTIDCFTGREFFKTLRVCPELQLFSSVYFRPGNCSSIDISAQSHLLSARKRPVLCPECSFGDFYFDTMANTILVGAQWGDEGKGKII